MATLVHVIGTFERWMGTATFEPSGAVQTTGIIDQSVWIVGVLF